MILLRYRGVSLRAKKGHACPVFENSEQPTKPYFKPKSEKHNY